MTSPARRGQIVTFYSYKGGTGRTMALANTAWILAANGKRVLVVDWDLEAPGLHRYFLPFMEDPDIKQTNGLLELVGDYIEMLPKNNSTFPPGIVDPLDLADVSIYATALNFDFNGGALHLLTSGCQDEDYANRVRGLDWETFYKSFSGDLFMERLRSTMRTHYDYVLLDSRTGVADVAGICTMQLPDTVVLCFTYNRQSVEGVAAVARSVNGYVESQGRKISLLPLPTRVVADVEGVEDARQFAQETLATHLSDFSNREELASYWLSAEIPHYPAYGFEETLATFKEPPGGRNNLLADMEWLAGRIAGQQGPLSLPRVSRGIRAKYLHRFRLRDPKRAALDEALQKDPGSAFRRLRAMAAEQPEDIVDTKWRTDLARAFQELSMLAQSQGHSEVAQEAAQETVAIYRQLAARAPDSFRPDLAMALHNLAKFLSDLGRRPEALSPAEESVALYRELAAKRPDAFGPNLATSLNNLANRLSALGRREEALGPAEEAVAIRRELAAKVPDAFRPDLALSLNNLATFLSDLGRREHALGPADEAVTIYRELAAKAPDAFRPGLAMSLSNLANSLSELGRREHALGPADEAVAIYRELAAKAPDAFRPDLANSLNNLAIRLSELGRREDALGPAEEAVVLYRELAAKVPDAFRPNLAQSLNNLAQRLSDLGRRQEALGPAEEAVAIQGEQASARPEAFGPGLARYLATLANILEMNDRLPDALERNRQAIVTYRPFFLGQPPAFAHWMTPMYQQYLQRCEKLGQEPDGELLGPIVEAIERLQAEGECSGGASA